MSAARPKVVYVTPELSATGANHFVHVAPLLSRIGERVDLAVCAERTQGEIDLPGIAELYCQRFGRGASARRWMETYGYARQMINRGYDRFFVRISVPAASAILAAARGGRARVFYWTCGLDWREPGWPPLRQWLRRTFVDRPAFRYLLRNVHRVVTGPERMVRYYREHFGVAAERLALLYNDIDLKRFSRRPGPGDVAELRRTLRLDEKAPVVLFVHHLSRRKGAHLLPEIARRLVHSHPDATLLVIGDGPERKNLADALAPLGDRVRVLGPVANRELDPYWAAADLYLLPSMEEGFPRVVLEAMAAGLPCVATDVGGVLDILPEEAHRWVVRPGDPRALGDAVLNALESPDVRAHVRAAGRRHVERFSTERVAEMFVRVLCEQS